MKQMMNVEQIEQQFGKVHQLIDNIFENQPTLSQNSNMFHLRFSMVLSAIVQMKNSLVKCLEHQAKEAHPQDIKTWTQVPIIDVADHFFDMDDENFTVYTPDAIPQHGDPALGSAAPSQQRENINLLLMFDDAVYIDFLMATLKSKEVRIVEFPREYDASSIIPFLLVNDHSIVVVRNPKKDVLPLLKLIMRKGMIFFKQHNQPIKVNITLWILLDVLPYIEKGKKGANDRKPPKKLHELVTRDYGVDFPNMFDLVVDISQYTNVDVLGTDYLKFQENLMLDRFAQHLDQNVQEPNSGNLFTYKELKCQCKSANLRRLLEAEVNQGRRKGATEGMSLISQKTLSLGEVFIQYYYLSQRSMH